MDAFEVIANKITKVPTYVLLSPYYTPILQLLPGAWCALLTTSPIHESQRTNVIHVDDYESVLRRLERVE